MHSCFRWISMSCILLLYLGHTQDHLSKLTGLVTDLLPKGTTAFPPSALKHMATSGLYTSTYIQSRPVQQFLHPSWWDVFHICRPVLPPPSLFRMHNPWLQPSLRPGSSRSRLATVPHRHTQTSLLQSKYDQQLSPFHFPFSAFCIHSSYCNKLPD